MTFRWITFLVVAAALLSGCATPVQTAVPLRNEAIAAPGTRVGIVLGTLPKPDTFFPGASCLLCMATASVANSALTDQVRTWSNQELLEVRDELAKLIGARGAVAMSIEQPLDLSRVPDRAVEPNRSRKDFSALRDANKLDKLLVVQFTAIGATRNYSAYIATGDPRATVSGTAYLVDLSSHALDWYVPLAVSVPASGSWDEPPKFPGLTNAYYQAIEMARDQIKQPFAK